MNPEEKNESNELSVKQQIIPEETSKRITALRFLLAMLVVFIHNNLNADEAINYYHLSFHEPIVITWIKTFVTCTIGGASVPLFYVFAGYLQFCKNDKYGNLLKKKSKSLLLPYCIWTIICVLAYYFGQAIPMLRTFFQNDINIVSNWKFHNWFAIFWNHMKGYPLVVQFWFVRDLMVLVILTPIIKYCIKKIPILTVICIVFCFIKELPLGFGTAAFFYIIGAVFAEYKIDFFNIADKLKWMELIPLLFVLSLFEMKQINTFGIGIIISCLFCLKLSMILIKNEKLFANLNYLSGFSFFLYAIHMPFLVTSISKISWKIIPMHGIGCLIQFIIPVVLTIIIGTSIGILLKKVCPPLFVVLNGGRR